MDKLTAYNNLNRTFSKKYIFNFGSEGGFYSEFNNMVFGIVYCLKHKYRFVLYSNNSKFKISKGWEDFFEPFVETVNSSFHKRFNKRLTAKKIKLRHYPRWYFFKFFNKDTYLTHELFHSFFNNDFYKEQFDFPELGIKGNLREVSNEIIKMIYNFNNVTETEIQKKITGLDLPEKYAALHVRKGDKDTEYDFMPTIAYIEKLKEVSSLKDVFIFTDDYTVIEYLQTECPDLHFYTLVNPDDRGYIHTDFMKLKRAKKKNDLIKMFASIEVLRNADITIGAFTTNPGMFLGITMPKDNFVSVQGHLF
jgi:hypothetical protein